MTYMWNLKYGKNDPIYETKIDHGQGEQICDCQGAGDSLGLRGGDYYI